MGGSEGAREASGVAENPVGNCHGVGGGVESPRGINIPGVEELPRGDNTSGVTPKGNRVLGEDIQGRGRDGTPLTTRETESRRDSGGNKKMTSEPGTAAAPRPHRGTAAGRGSKVRPHRHPDGAKGAVHERASKYSLLVPAELACDPDAAEIQEGGDGHEATMGTGDQYVRETDTGDQTGKRALLARGMPEDADKERIPPKRQHALNACSHQGGGGERGGIPYP